MGNNQPPSPKETLRSGLSVPKSIEASLPTGAPQFSAALANMVESLPEIQAPSMTLPKLPVGPAGLPAGVPQLTDFIKGIESALPQGAPKLADTVNNAIAGKTVVGIEREPAVSAAAVKVGL